MDLEPLRSGGLLRFPWFLRDCVRAIESQQPQRAAAGLPSLISHAVRLEDFAYTLIFALLLFTFRIALQRTVFARLFRGYAPSLAAKLSENLFYIMYYVFAFSMYVFVLMPRVEWGANLLSNHTSIVMAYLDPFPPPLLSVERYYYIISAGFYLSATVFIVFFDTRRSDFYQTLVHHTVTIGMVTMSYLYGYIRTGMNILALHDIGDIFLYSSKFFHNLAVAGVDVALFVCFAATFYITRLVMYSRFVHSVVVEALQMLVMRPEFNQWGMFYDTYLVHYVFFFIFMFTLLGLQCFWFTMILRLIVDELFYGKKLTDIREADDDDDPVEPHPPFTKTKT